MSSCLLRLKVLLETYDLNHGCRAGVPLIFTYDFFLFSRTVLVFVFVPRLESLGPRPLGPKPVGPRPMEMALVEGPPGLIGHWPSFLRAMPNPEELTTLLFLSTYSSKGSLFSQFFGACSQDAQLWPKWPPISAVGKCYALPDFLVLVPSHFLGVVSSCEQTFLPGVARRGDLSSAPWQLLDPVAAALLQKSVLSN